MQISSGDGVGSPFKIRRPRITTNGFVSDVDKTVKGFLEELDGLLAKRVFANDDDSNSLDVTTVLTAPLTPKQLRGENDGGESQDSWADDSLGQLLHDAKEHKNDITLSEYIDRTPELSELRFRFDDQLRNLQPSLDYNTQTILSDRLHGIRDYLVVLSRVVGEVEDIYGLTNFVVRGPKGVKNVVDYAAVTAARSIIRERKLVVSRYNDDNGTLANDVRKASLSLASISFESALVALVGDRIFNSDEAKLIDEAKIGPIPPELKPELVKLIRSSRIEITKDNVNFFLPLFISQLVGNGTVADSTPASPEESERDFDVDFFQDDQSLIQVSRSAVKCAAQLYYGMVTGDELNVFAIADYFTHKYLIRGEIEISDTRLRNNLQRYVFSHQFTDPKTGQLVDRTRPAERQMFYRQVFAEGNGQVTEDVIVNEDFPQQWNCLMLMSAEYLERAQSSFNPDSFVSRQKVMQAVEDLQYNLSTHCTGMTNVITPLIYTELNFVIKEIFMHPEVLRQVVPVGATWWRVVERLYMEMQHARPKATVLYNKAKLGHDIITAIADYNPATFEEDANFSAFISHVDAYITTQSILQDVLTDDLKRDHEKPPPLERYQHPAPAPEPVGVPAGANGKSDDWDF
jgi:hypothetical protein